MKVINQEGRAAFNLEQAISYELEDITESKRKKYLLPRGPIHAVTIYYSIGNPECLKVVVFPCGCRSYPPATINS